MFEGCFCYIELEFSDNLDKWCSGYQGRSLYVHIYYPSTSDRYFKEGVIFDTNNLEAPIVM